MSAGLTLRIDALHGPSRQITHAASVCARIERLEQWERFSGQAIVVSSSKLLLIVVQFPNCRNPIGGQKRVPVGLIRNAGIPYSGDTSKARACSLVPKLPARELGITPNAMI